MGIGRGLFSMFDKLDDIVYEPVNTMTNWMEEPLRQKEHNREKDLRRQQSELLQKEKDREVERDIRRETGIAETLVELEEMKKDAEVERQKEVARAAQEYQKTLMRINTDAVRELGEMHIELREKAENMISEMTKRYNKMQKEAIEESGKQLKEIEEDFGGNDRMMEIMTSAVEKKMANVIDNADRFIKRLHDSLEEIHGNLNVLTEEGHRYVLENAQQFRALADREGARELLRENWDEVKDQIPEADYEELASEVEERESGASDA
jgi:HPt (histidine-containing phosphotransfer) domain-containing protein